MIEKIELDDAGRVRKGRERARFQDRLEEALKWCNRAHNGYSEYDGKLHTLTLEQRVEQNATAMAILTEVLIEVLKGENQ